MSVKPNPDPPKSKPRMLAFSLDPKAQAFPKPPDSLTPNLKAQTMLSNSVLRGFSYAHACPSETLPSMEPKDFWLEPRDISERGVFRQGLSGGA